MLYKYYWKILVVSPSEGGKLSAIARRPFLDGVSVSNASNGQSNAIMQLIELQQYLKASWYNEIGLNSNFNMKSQYISSDEINASADIMLPLVDNMYECRKMCVDSINSTFGTDITVEKDSAWEKKQMQSDLSVLPGSTEESLLDSTVDETDVQRVAQNGEDGSDA